MENNYKPDIRMRQNMTHNICSSQLSVMINPNRSRNISSEECLYQNICEHHAVNSDILIDKKFTCEVLLIFLRLMVGDKTHMSHLQGDTYMYKQIDDT